MCGSTSAPKVVQQDPVAEQAKVDAKAASAANSALSLRRQQLSQNSLLTMGARGTDPGVDTPYNLLSTVTKPKRAVQLQNYLNSGLNKGGTGTQPVSSVIGNISGGV